MMLTSKRWFRGRVHIVVMITSKRWFKDGFILL